MSRLRLKLFPPNLLDRIRPSEAVVLIGTALMIGAGSGLGAVIFTQLIALVQRSFFEGGESIVAIRPSSAAWPDAMTAHARSAPRGSAAPRTDRDLAQIRRTRYGWSCAHPIMNSIATPPTATSVPTTACNPIASLNTIRPIGRRKIGGSAINVLAIPTSVRCTAIKDNHTPM